MSSQQRDSQTPVRMSAWGPGNAGSRSFRPKEERGGGHRLSPSLLFWLLLSRLPSSPQCWHRRARPPPRAVAGRTRFPVPGLEGTTGALADAAAAARPSLSPECTGPATAHCRPILWSSVWDSLSGIRAGSSEVGAARVAHPSAQKPCFRAHRACGGICDSPRGPPRRVSSFRHLRFQTVYFSRRVLHWFPCSGALVF